MNDLIQRLRDYAAGSYSGHGLMSEAAAEIERLQRERDDLIRVRDGLMRDVDRACHSIAERATAIAQPFIESAERQLTELRGVYDLSLIENERAERQRDEAVAALRELVRLKDLHDAIEKDDAAGRVVDGMRTYYDARKPLAWDAARRLLKPAEEEKHG